jgi:hypothetical protein
LPQKLVQKLTQEFAQLAPEVAQEQEQEQERFASVQQRTPASASRSSTSFAPHDQTAGQLPAPHLPPVQVRMSSAAEGVPPVVLPPVVEEALRPLIFACEHLRSGRVPGPAPVLLRQLVLRRTEA